MSVTRPAYSRSRTWRAPCCRRSAKHLTEMETRILVFVSGVEMWKVTPSKSEMTWSIDAGVGLGGVGSAIPLVEGGLGSLPVETFCQNRLQEEVVVFEEELSIQWRP